MARAGRILLRRAGTREVPELLLLAKSSARVHRPWVYLPGNAARWRASLNRGRQGRIAYAIRRRDTRELVGVVNLSEIVRGVFKSGYLGFYAHAAHARQGFMKEALRAVIGRAFGVHRLHRVEANIQPGNVASLALVRSLGFRREGFSPRYLKIGGRWRDHERWAVTRESWRARERKGQA
jgi:ribosomal-protein-alanine N-acetyltransferase